MISIYWSSNIKVTSPKKINLFTRLQVEYFVKILFIYAFNTISCVKSCCNNRHPNIAFQLMIHTVAKYYIYFFSSHFLDVLGNFRKFIHLKFSLFA